MSLNEWWDDLVAPTREILLVRLFIVGVGVVPLVELGWTGLPFSLLLWGVAGGLRLRGQRPRAVPYATPPAWCPPVAWTFEPGDHAVELVASLGPPDRVNSALVRALALLTDGSLRQVRDAIRAAPSVVRRGLSQHSAETAVRLLEASQARARVVPPAAGTSRP